MRSPRMIQLMHDLLVAGEHPDIVSVEYWDDPGSGLKPCGVVVRMRSGNVAHIRGLTAAPPGGYAVGTEDTPLDPDYSIPEGVRTCHLTADAVGAGK